MDWILVLLNISSIVFFLSFGVKRKKACERLSNMLKELQKNRKILQ